MTEVRRHLRLLIVLAAGLLAGCSGSDAGDVPEEKDSQAIRLDADIWQMMAGIPAKAPTRATTYDNATALQAAAHFHCYAYDANTTTVYDGINTTVDWNGTMNQWIFSGGAIHRWPATGSLDFFAYMPATPPAYITDLTYAARNPQFGCTSLPMTKAGQDAITEFVYALVTDQNKATQGSTGVTLTFQHPFARIKLQTSSTQETININTITLKGIKANGTYTVFSRWTPTGDATNFVATIDEECSASAALGTYIMIPQSWAGEIEVNATWNEWGEPTEHTVTATVPTTWEAGRSYTYTLTITPTDLLVDTAKFTEQW